MDSNSMKLSICINGCKKQHFLLSECRATIADIEQCLHMHTYTSKQTHKYFNKLSSYSIATKLLVVVFEGIYSIWQMS